MSLREQFIEELKQFDPYVAERVFPHKGNPPPAIEYRCHHYTVVLLLKELDRQDERCKALERKLTAMAELYATFGFPAATEALRVVKET